MRHPRGIIELYEDRRSGWRVLISRGGTIGYRFIIVDRAGRSTFAADATELACGRVPAGLQRVDLDADSGPGMVLVEPCALWSRGRVRRTGARPGVLTAAYISGEMTAEESAGTSSNGSKTNRRRTTAAADTRLFVTQITGLVAANEQLRRANRELVEANQRLRGELTAISSALGSLTDGRRGRRRGTAVVLALPETRLRRRRRPITGAEAAGQSR